MFLLFRTQSHVRAEYKMIDYKKKKPNKPPKRQKPKAFEATVCVYYPINVSCRLHPELPTLVWVCETLVYRIKALGSGKVHAAREQNLLHNHHAVMLKRRPFSLGLVTLDSCYSQWRETGTLNVAIHLNRRGHLPQKYWSLTTDSIVYKSIETDIFINVSVV